MLNDPDKDVYRWIDKHERRKKLKWYLGIVAVVLAVMLVWILQRTHFIVILSLPQLIGIVVVVLVILGILMLI